MAAVGVDVAGKPPPQDLVAIFHASFHPTKGNIIDWSHRARDDVSLDHLEFSCLPSGLHLVERDVVYFSHDNHAGLCIFRRRPTTDDGHRGFRLSSLGILLAPSARPRPWLHLSSLKELVHLMYSQFFEEPTDKDWQPALQWFDERKARTPDLGGAGDWAGWGPELDGLESTMSVTPPVLHLPHLLRILGPSVFTLYKHVLGRKRVLIFTLPPVEPACVLCHVAADLCFESQYVPDDQANEGPAAAHRLRGKSRRGVNVLGIVTLNDLDRMKREGESGSGWVACTTDAIFLDKPAYYDLLIDLTSITASKSSRPNLHVSLPVPRKPSSPRSTPTHVLSPIRSSWSDIRLWTEIDRLLRLDGSSHNHDLDHEHEHGLPSALGKDSPWPDIWRIYEDVCVICAGLWFGSWRRNSLASYSTLDGADPQRSQWGAARAPGDLDLSMPGGFSVRGVGAGIEGRPSPGPTTSASGGIENRPAGKRPSKHRRRGSSATALVGQPSESDDLPEDASEVFGKDPLARRASQVATTRALLQTFHAHAKFQLDTLAGFLPTDLAGRYTDAEGRDGSVADAGEVLSLTPKDVLAFELGPLNALDARFVEWIGDEYGGGVQVVVKRGWKDLFGLFLGLG